MALRQIAPGAAGLADFASGLRLSPSMYFTYAEHNRDISVVGRVDHRHGECHRLGEPEQVRTVAVSDGVLQALGVPPAVGRWLSQDRSSSARAGTRDAELWILAAAVRRRPVGRWAKHHGGFAATGNRRRDAAKDFRFVDTDFDVIVPLAFDRGKMILAGFGFHGIARLKPGVTIARSQCGPDANAADLDGLVVERSRHESAYL